MVIPFSYIWILKKIIGNNIRTVLDLGCDQGNLMTQLSMNRCWEITGVELYDDSIKLSKKTGTYTQIVKADVTKLPKSILKNKYDLVFSSQVLEHLKKREGERALAIWEKLAKKRMVISTPVGFILYERIETTEEEKNPLQKHLSGWAISELYQKGYKVRGQGLVLIYGKNGLARKFPKLLKFFSVMSLIFAPFVYFYPRLATYMVAWKDK